MLYYEVRIDHAAADEYGLDPVQYFIDARIKFVLADGGNTLVLHEPMSEDEIHEIAGPALDNELIFLD
jgi:hypothetical protein